MEESPFEREGTRFIPVPISDEEIEDFYEGFSNGTIWPLFHDAIRPPTFDPEWWSAYERINKRYAEYAAEAADDGALVWVHDYQLLLVPALLRELRPDLRIGFFLHISFPPQELFMQLPWRRQLLEGVLGADVIGFQVPIAARNFAVLANRLTSASGRGGTLSYDGREIAIGTYPASIDVSRFASASQRVEVQLRAKEIREQLGNPRRVLLGVDRLDYTKGIEARLRAYGELLAKKAVSVPDTVMVQIAVPTRSNVPAYVQLRTDIEGQVGELNGDYGQMGVPALHYLHQNLEFEELVALYLAADVLLVTPFRDGMNLVAKEYVASRNGTGALVLSEFAGSAVSMTQAYLVNPHDGHQLEAAILTALNAPLNEQHRRMRYLQRSVSAWTNEDWVGSFLQVLNR